MANKKVSQLTSKPSVLTTDLFPIADPSTGQLYKTTISDLGTAIGSGVSSVNTLVGAVVLDTDDIQELVSPTNKWFTDTRARAALSASSPLTYNSGTGAFGIQVATGSQNGYLSSTDWTTFNAKQAALSGTGFVKSTGGTISYDTNTYLTTSSAASTYLALGGGTMTGSLIGTSAGFTGYVGIGNTSPLYQLDVTGSGRFSGDLRIESTNPRIYLTDTDNNPDYFISNTDGTFTIYDVTNSTSRFTIGTTGNATFTNAITGGGSITGESLYSNGIISAGSSVTATRLILSGGTSPTGLYFGHTDKVVLANYTVGGGIDFETNGGNITMQLSSGGVLSTTGGINTTTGVFSSNVQIGGAAISGNSNSFYNTTSETSVLIKQTSGASYITQALWNNAITGDNRFIRFFGETTATNRGGIVYDRTSDKLNLVGEGGGLLFTGASTFSSTIISNNSITAIGASTAGFVTSLLVKNPSTNSASAVKIGFDGGGTTWGEIGASYNSNSPYMAFFVRANSEKMRITDAGNVGIGTTAPNSYNADFSNLVIANTSSFAGMTIATASNSYGTIAFADGTSGIQKYAGYIQYSHTDDAMALATNATERMRITSGGAVLLTGNLLSGCTSDPGAGSATTGSSLGASGYVIAQRNAATVGYFGRGTNNGELFAFYRDTTQVGSISVTTSLTSYNVTSDYRLKQDFKSVDGLDIVNKIKVYNYEWKSDNTRMDGVIAHELAEVLPYAVTGIKDGEQMQSVDYSKIVPVMVQAIKDLKAELDTLKNK